MKNKSSISTIRLVMIFSQFLLALFLGYWIYNQFGNQKEFLTEEIERGLRKSEQQVMDSTIAAQLINPVLFDTMHRDVRIIDSAILINEGMPMALSIELDSIHELDKLINVQGQNNTPKNHTIITELMIDGDTNLENISDISSPRIIVNSHGDTNNQLLIQTVKMFIKSVGHTDAIEGKMSEFISLDVDTLLLKTLFSDFIQNNYRGFQIEWLNDQDLNAPIKKNRKILLESQLFEKTYTTSISRYQPNIIKAIIPQIVFALLLLLITSIAFWMAYLNMKSQRKLIALKNDFISNITHELKTPVSTVKVAIEALLDFNLKKDEKLTKEYLLMAKSELNRLDLLVSQVLNNSALEDEDSFIVLKEINLNLLVEEVISSMQIQLNSSEAIVHFNPKEDEFIVKADHLHIHGVLLNLIDNSLKYSNEKAEISINISKSSKEISLTLSDNGSGIPEEYIDKVFDKFFRVPTGDQHNVKGYGLGLNYAALVMKHHKGSITVNNNQEDGCTFTLHFPISSS